MTESALNRLLLENSLSVATLIKIVMEIIQSQTNGYIHLKTITGERWWLDFRVGRLLWAGGGQHRFRRWQRLLQNNCQDLQPSQVRLREVELSDHWEYTALSVLLKRQQLNREVAISIIQDTLSEVLFDIFQAVENITELSHTTDHSPRLTQPIAILSSTALFYPVKNSLKAWQNTGLGNLSPNLAPAIVDAHGLKQCTQPRTYQLLKRLLQGKRSVRELSQITEQEIFPLGHMLKGYVERGMVILNPVGDLTSPYASVTPKVSPQAEGQQPLVFCIDDSPQVGYVMEETLRPAGYRCTSIQDSVHALAQIIRHKPSLIFLDLIMPVANGYEICKQIRRIKDFRKTPIVILTGNDGIVDRMRAKAVGATDFMSKPIDPIKVLDIVNSQLTQREYESIES